MTIWDRIYQDYQRGGQAWASLAEGIHPLFIAFLAETDLNTRHVLDIGCGTGKYLELLQAAGFRTDGIDSSATAVEMTRRSLGSDSQIICADMFDYQIPKDKYDLIISISTIHHGHQEQIRDLVDEIHASLLAGGAIFITIPDQESSRKWDTFQDRQQVTQNTFVPLQGPEKGLPHSFFSKADAQRLFSRFSHADLALDERGRWIIQAVK